MNLIRSKINDILSDRKELEKFLLIEKERRGISKEKLVFAGMANIAEYYWCAMKSLLESKKEELGFFRAYLYDRLSYSYDLGLIKKISKRGKDILEIGNKINFDDIEKLLEDKAKNKSEILILSEIKIDQNGNKLILINTDTTPEERIFIEEEAKSKGIRIADLEEFPLIRGEFLETSKAEKYASIRWNFSWENYVLIGVPDGITNNFVYEFKTTRKKYFIRFVGPVARTQADLYGFFFKRRKKRVQIYCIEEKYIDTIENDVDTNRVLEVLANFKKVDFGWPPQPPKSWKCTSCKFKEICSLIK